MDRVTECAISLIRAEICGDTNIQHYKLNTDESVRLIEFCIEHDIAALVGTAAQKNGVTMDADISKAFSSHIMMAVYRYERIKYEYDKLCRLFEEAGIKFVPLKGTVVRNLYPNPELRTSCDIDILVHEDDLGAAEKILLESGDYKSDTKGSHDITFFGKSGLHIEIHFSLIEYWDSDDDILRRPWEYVSYPNGGCRGEFTNEFMITYHIAHIAKHFIHGGSGIRNFIDLWLMKRKLEYDDEKLSTLIECAKMTTFADNACRLSDIWFSKKGEYTPLLLNMENFILGAGIYGSTESKAAMDCAVYGGKLANLKEKFFRPLSVLQYEFPFLKKHPRLYPIAVPMRWVRILFSGRLRSIAHEVSVSNSLKGEKLNSTSAMLEELNLMNSEN